MQLLKNTLTLAAIATTIGSAEARADTEYPCLTQDECDSKVQEMGVANFYVDNAYTTKGCYMKNGKAFFALGTEDEMSSTELVGVLERIWCDGNSSNDAVELSGEALGLTFPASAPTDGDGVDLNGEALELTFPASAPDGDDAADKAIAPENSAVSIGAISFNLGVAAAIAGMSSSLLF